MNDPKAVTEMFDDISGNYDSLNHLLSFNIDRIWRRKTSQWVAKRRPDTILDVATGTADLAIQLAKDNPQALVTGVDLSAKMLSIGQQKIARKRLSNRIGLEVADASALPYADNRFDVVTVAFGVRNFADREKGLRELFRVCRDGGWIVVLEFSHPTDKMVKVPYRWYSRRWIPWIGQKVSKHPDAYRYLPASVEAFPSTEAFKALLTQIGLRDIQIQSFSGGIATLYCGQVSKNRESLQ